MVDKIAFTKREIKRLIAAKPRKIFSRHVCNDVLRIVGLVLHIIMPFELDGDSTQLGECTLFGEYSVEVFEIARIRAIYVILDIDFDTQF